MISNLIKWDHKQDYFLYKYDENIDCAKIFNINIQDQDFEFISGHEIDGKYQHF